MQTSLEVFLRRYDELTRKLSEPAAFDPKQYAALMKEQSEAKRS